MCLRLWGGWALPFLLVGLRWVLLPPMQMWLLLRLAGLYGLDPFAGRSTGTLKHREANIMNREKLMKMAGAVRTGGKGTVRRKKKTVHKTTTTDDKRLQSTLKRINVNNIPAIEEVNIFKDDYVIHFANPKVQASIPANTWVVSGSSQTKKLQDLFPSIINQLGPDSFANLKKLAEQFQKREANHAEGGVDDDDDVPELVEGETFEEAAKADSAS